MSALFSFAICFLLSSYAGAFLAAAVLGYYSAFNVDSVSTLGICQQVTTVPQRRDAGTIGSGITGSQDLHPAGCSPGLHVVQVGAVCPRGSSADKPGYTQCN